MTIEFVLTEHVYRILTGTEGKSGRKMKLICAAPTCLHVPKGSPDPNFGREIVPTGYGVCPRCKNKIDIADMIKEGKLRKAKCDKCALNIVFLSKKPSEQVKGLNYIVWTTVVVSKHRKKTHRFFHKECYEACYIETADVEESDDEINSFFAWLRSRWLQ